MGGAFSKRQAEIMAARPMSIKQVEFLEEKALIKQQEDNARDELALLGLAPEPRKWEPKAKGADYEDFDESGFFPEENDPLIYISRSEALDTNYAECHVAFTRVAIRKKPSEEEPAISVD